MMTGHEAYQNNSKAKGVAAGTGEGGAPAQQ